MEAKGRFLVDMKGFSYWCGAGQQAAPTSTQKITKKVDQPKETGPKYEFSTIKDYFNDTYKFESTAKLLDIIENNGEFSLVTDLTIFHPQGGGQPKDEGFITSADNTVKFKVTDLKGKDDAILHIGKYESGTFKVGDQVKLLVDGEFRKQNARIHSAGHLLDIAMQRAG